MPLNKPEIKRVLGEMRRLEAAIDELEDATSTHTGYSLPKQTGAVRRASMDLTRALADLRKWG